MAAALLLLGTSPARAYRPFIGTDAGVASEDRLEVEFGPLGYTRTGDMRQLIAPEVELTYGAGSGYEFGAGARRLMLMNPDPDGAKPTIDDIELTATRLLRPGSVQDKKGVSLMAEATLLVPASTGDHFGVGLLLAASRIWADLALHLNGEVSRTREGDEGRFASLIAEGPDAWNVRPVAEASLEREGEETALRSLLLGVIWQTRNGLAMDFAFRTGYADERLSEFRSGITWNRHVSGPRMP